MGDAAMPEETLRWFAGIDWGSAKHQACLLDGAGTVVGERAFAHGGAGLAALCDWLVSMAGDTGSVAVASRCPTDRWWMPCCTAASRFMRSIPSSSSARATEP